MGSVLHEPYVTTKHGQLRSKRKQNKDPISAVDDLATLENLEEVGLMATLISSHLITHLSAYV